MRILGIESTCDETSAAIVDDGRFVFSNVVASSLEIHKKYGGIVPELAAREQIRVIIPVLDKCLKDIKIKKLDAIAVSHGPGLIGSLLIGVETAKTLAIAWEKPLIPINHLIGHVYANWLTPVVNRKPTFPLVALIVSGGHTDLILMTDHGKYQWLGGTLDDAAGEAFDKVARILGLGYPGGPEIERVASRWSLVTSNQKLETSYHLPRPLIDSPNFDFSFSGLKTAVINLVSKLQQATDLITQITYEFQQAIVDVLVTKTIRAANKYNAETIVVGGGVAANSELRSRMTEIGNKNNIKVFFPKKKLAIDNGAMIAAAAYFLQKTIDPLKLETVPSLHLI